MWRCKNLGDTPGWLHEGLRSQFNAGVSPDFFTVPGSGRGISVKKSGTLRAGCGKAFALSSTQACPLIFSQSHNEAGAESYAL